MLAAITIALASGGKPVDLLGVVDADEFVATRSQSLRSPHDYEEIVEVLAGVGRVDEAVDWARRGSRWTAENTRRENHATGWWHSLSTAVTPPCSTDLVVYVRLRC